VVPKSDALEVVFILRKRRFSEIDFIVIFSIYAEYKDDNVEIPSGSSVIIKRVPAGFASPLAM